MAASERKRKRRERQSQTLARNTNKWPKSHAPEIRRRHRSGRQQPVSDPRSIEKTISRNLIIVTTSEESAQGRYPSTIGGPRSPTSHQEKEAWMGRSHNAKKR
uniref:Uncharacterized protein n=1 Tax=Caenorhabditis japonica TaxID=281687 RepID=A0A8R1I9D2_CAEJA